MLLGTVQGDIHDIGKNMVAMLLECNGFWVYDLGVDEPPGEFLEKASSLKPKGIGTSGLLPIAYESMRETLQTRSCNTGSRIAFRTPIPPTGRTGQSSS